MSSEVSKDQKAASAALSTPSPSHYAAAPPSAPKKVKIKDCLSELLERAKFDEAVERDRDDYEKVLHQKRMGAILNEMKFLEKTEWMYPSVESILGFKDERSITLTSRYESSANHPDIQMFRDRNS